MTSSRIKTAGSFSLGLSLLIFCVYFLNVLVGGPMGRKPFMSDVGEMLTLFAAVIFFVAGTICREAQGAGDGSPTQTRGGA
ncbi:MAG TPA: hypothetical protein VIT02_08710 [Burkholderiaceae bacterium]